MVVHNRLDKNKICNSIRSKYPEAFGIRRSLQKLKISRLYRRKLPASVVAECEKNPQNKIAIIQPYVKKWSRNLRPIFRDIEEIMTKSPAFADLEDLESIKADMLFTNLAYGFLPSEYAGFHFEIRSLEERKEFVSDLDTNLFGYTVNSITEIQKFIDKGEGYKLTSQYFLRDAIVIENKKDYYLFEQFVHKHPIFVKKKVFSSMGKGVELVDLTASTKKLRTVFEEIISSGKYLIEEKVVQHETLARINPSSVNTVRCITLNTNSGIVVPYCFFKVGRKGSFVDNAGAGGIVVGVNPETGACNTDGFTEYGELYESHPETKVVFKELQLPAWHKLLDLCKEISREFPQMGYLSYDLAYTDKGWVLIEVNEVGQFIIPQIVRQKGIKKELFGYMEIMNKVI